MTDSNNDSETPAAVLLAAHVAFELEQWRGQGAAARLRDEIDAFWRWAEAMPLDALIDAESASAVLRRALLDADPAPELMDALNTLVRHLGAIGVPTDTRVRDVIDEAVFDEAVALFVDLEALRNRLIRGVMSSPMASTVAADVLYRGIKGYIFADSGALGSIPGVSRFLRGSSSALNKRLPGLEAEVEKRVRAYIANNTAKTLARSEAYFMDSLDPDTIQTAAAVFWDHVKDRPLSAIRGGGLQDDERERLTDFTQNAWQALSQTQYVDDALDAAVHAYLERHGQRSLADLLAEFGIDDVFLRRRAETIAPGAIAGLADSGVLEAVVRRRLAAFYDSPVFAQAFAAAVDRPG